MNELTSRSVDFGGSNDYSGVSTSRTLMLSELSMLLESMPIDATADDYKRAIVAENVLLKPSGGTRAKTYSFLRDRFALDPAVPVFSVLRYLWERDRPGRPLLALLVAAFRDPVLRAAFENVLTLQPGQSVLSRDFAHSIETHTGTHFSAKSLKAAGERASSTFKQSGHLSKNNPPMRQRVEATPGSATLALLLASLNGAGGLNLLQTTWARLLDSPDELLLAQVRVAAGRGWLEYRHAGNVLEITFYRLLEEITQRI